MVKCAASLVISFDKANECIIVRSLVSTKSIKIKPFNLSILTRCLGCSGEISTTQCYACSYFDIDISPNRVSPNPFANSDPDDFTSMPPAGTLH